MRTGWMRRRGIIFLLAVLMFLSCFSFSADAQVSTIPRTISYQGYLTNATGAPVNGTIEMVFSIFNVLSGGAPLWNETQTSVPVINGIYNVILGSVNEINLPFNTPYYLGMSIGGRSYRLGRPLPVLVMPSGPTRRMSSPLILTVELTSLRVRLPRDGLIP